MRGARYFRRCRIFRSVPRETGVQVWLKPERWTVDDEASGIGHTCEFFKIFYITSHTILSNKLFVLQGEMTVFELLEHLSVASAAWSDICVASAAWPNQSAASAARRDLCVASAMLRDLCATSAACGTCRLVLWRGGISLILPLPCSPLPGSISTQNSYWPWQMQGTTKKTLFVC